MKDKFDIVFDRLKAAKLGENVLCSEFWRKLIALHRNFNEADCWKLLVENIEWVINTGTITTDDLISWFAPEDLNEHNIYVSGQHKINNGLAVGMGSAKIEAVGHSRVILFDRAHCDAYDTTFVTGFNTSSMALKNCTGEAFNDCSVIARDFSKVEAWDNVRVKAETYSCVMAHDNAVVENSENSHAVIV